jgi:hypothetical protein
MVAMQLFARTHKKNAAITAAFLRHSKAVNYSPNELFAFPFTLLIQSLSRNASKHIAGTTMSVRNVAKLSP